MHPLQQDSYASDHRIELVPFLPRDSKRVLDVGCAHGGFAGLVKQQLGSKILVDGVEPVQTSFEAARANEDTDRVFHGFYPEALPVDAGPYDLICFNDVLEHVVDPWAMVAATRDHLAPGGRLMASIPSVQFAPVLWSIARGHFDYTETGTLDRTHLRFFTKRTIEALFESQGFEIEFCHGINPIARGIYQRRGFMSRAGIKLARRLLGNATFLQFVVVTKPLGASAERGTGVPSGSGVAS